MTVKKCVYDEYTCELLRVEDAEPECGVDFCDRCGDCLHCYEYGPCYDGTEECDEHFWVAYESKSENVHE